MDAYVDGNGLCFPYDVLLHVLRRLPRLALAESRRVCRAWRAIVDAHNLLLFPPRDFPGIFTDRLYGCWNRCSYLLAPPASSPRRPPLFWYADAKIKDCCNGLLLQQGAHSVAYVCNPATARRAPLPCLPMPWSCYRVKGMFLAFDPGVSRHYDVFLFHGERCHHLFDETSRAWINSKQRRLPKLFGEKQKDAATKEPAAAKPVTLLVFSSRTGRWESREFVPGRRAPGHLYGVMAAARGSWEWSSEFWRGSLYVHCHSDVLMVLHCSEGTYDMVRLPGKAYGDIKYSYLDLPLRSLLVSYDRGVRYAAIDGSQQLQVWTFIESDDGGQLGTWVLAHEASLNNIYGDIRRKEKTIPPRMTWKVVRSRERPDAIVDDVEGGKREYSWNSDEDNFVEVDGTSSKGGFCSIMGLHPHKDVLLLGVSGMAAAYHLDTSRVQYLSYTYTHADELRLRDQSRTSRAFPYRPCYVDVLPRPAKRV